MNLARAVTSLATISIIENPQYKGLRSCAGSCLAAGQFFATDLVGYIGCTYPYYNTCYCNSVIVPQASSFVSSCVSAGCSEVADVPNAFSAWEGYCSSAGFPVNNIAQTTVDASSSGGVAVQTTVQVTVQTTAAPTATATVSGGSNPSGGTIAIASTVTTDSSSQGASTPASSGTSTQLNVGAIAGGVVGGVVVLGIAAIVITMLLLRDRRQRREQQLAQPQGQQHSQAPFAPPQGQQPSQAPSAPPFTTEKIFKTPVIASTIPVWRAEESVQHEPELDGRGRMAPELQGWGNTRPRSNVPEMQA